jgi:Kef-type K+ transport system membrane component KefB
LAGVNVDLFIQLGIVVMLAGVAAFALRWARQPQILAYVLVGVLITPILGLITETALIESMSIIGIAFLLFLVGLEMDLKSLRNVALVGGLGGMIQISILFVVGYLSALAMGFVSLEAAYVGLFLAFSSTMVVMKLLSDRRELNTLHGRIVIGILLVEDIVAILALSVLTSINDFSLMVLGLALLKFVLLFAAAYLASKFLFPSIFKFAARHQEVLFVSALAVCFAFSLAFHYLGFSIAIGAFVAGIALGNLQYSLEIASKMRSLRDFFSLLFFVSLGMGLHLGVIKKMWVTILVMLFVIMFFKPVLVMVVCSLFKYTKKPAFLTANSLAQMGEFSLIVAAQGLALKHISEELFSTVVLVALFTITTTSYFIKYQNWFYGVMTGPLKIFDSFTTEGLEYLPTEVKPKIILAGHNRIGYSILKNLDKVKKKVLVVDYNPEVINMMVEKGYHCLYGDVTDDEIMERMNLRHITMLISTVPRVSENILLIRKVRKHNKRAKIIVTATDIECALQLYNHGASYVILPHFLGGEHVGKLIAGMRSKKIKLNDQKERHIAHIKATKGSRHDYPSHI